MAKNKKYQKRPRVDIFQQVADKVLAQMDTAGTDWLKSWAVPKSEQPISMSTGKHYNGINWLILGMARAASGYKSGQWATYNQWKTRNAQVQTGQRGESVVLYKPWVRENKLTGEIINGRVLKAFTVFNADQVHGYEVPDAGETINLSEGNPETIFDKIAEQVGAEVQHADISNAFCEGRGAYINMPYCNQFDSPEAYAATGFHELTHWTGAAKRLERESFLKYRKNRPLEELIAELGAAMLCGQTGVSPEPRPDHAIYLNSWMRSIKDDPKAIFKAVAKASAAANFINDAAKMPSNGVVIREYEAKIAA